MKTITIVAGSEATCAQIERQLAEYLEGEEEVRLRGYSLDRGLSGRIEMNGNGDLILLTSSLVRDDLLEAGLLGADVPVIVAERTVNPQRLDLVVALAPGTKVLFVNDEEETVRECVSALKALGLDYLEYVPWYPGCPAPQAGLEIAITPGEAALVPPGIPRVIDLGARVLDFATLAEILDGLGLFERRIGRFSKLYLKKIIQVAQSLARSNEEAGRLNRHLKGVLEALSRGILVYDSAGRVTVCNENLRSLLNIRIRDPHGMTLSALIRNKALLEFLEGPHADESGVFRLSDCDLVVRRFETAEGRIATFRDEGKKDAAETRGGLANRKRGYIAKYDMEDIVGESQAIQRARRIASRLAATDLTILINGESGTGKELFASAIHAASSRRTGPFLAVDIGSLSDDLIESELFGYEDGAFTGARKGGKPGLFELADGGTIFLDEIGHISAKVQTRLLRVLQEKEVLRVGGADIKRIDVRVIAASNEDLLERVKKGAFRQDLFFRLKTGLLRIPPLRERREDIPLLIEAFLKAEGEAGVTVEGELLVIFADYAWPGNIRELRNLIAYMLAVKEGESMTLCDLPDEGFFEGLSVPVPTCADLAAGVPPHSWKDAKSELSAVDAFLLEAVGRLEREGKVAGRASLSRLAAEGGRELSPAMIRARLERLADRGLVVSGRGRRGTRLSPAGKMAL